MIWQLIKRALLELLGALLFAFVLTVVALVMLVGVLFRGGQP